MNFAGVVFGAAVAPVNRHTFHGFYHVTFANSIVTTRDHLNNQITANHPVGSAGHFQLDVCDEPARRQIITLQLATECEWSMARARCEPVPACHWSGWCRHRPGAVQNDL